MRQRFCLVMLTACSVCLFSCEEKKPDLHPELREVYLSPILFEILGYLDEYGGRMISLEPDSHLEHFYASQKTAADQFEKLLYRFQEEYGLHTEIIRENGPPPGSHIDFYSEEIAAIVNSCYVPILGPIQSVDPEDQSVIGESYTCVLDTSIIEHASNEEKLSYLKGVYTRYGEKNSFAFANSAYKCNITIDILSALGCREIKTMSLRYIPVTNVIVFQPSDTVREYLGITSYRDIVIRDVDPNDLSWKN